MAVYRIDPLLDPRWPAFLARQPGASVFHTSGWLEALRRTYGYKPVGFTTSAPEEELRNGLVFCRVSSWLTGCRLVSVPFSDHCQPLVDSSADLEVLASSLKEHLHREKWKFIELRPLISCSPDLDRQTLFAKSAGFYIHKLDIRPDLDALFHNFHKGSVRGSIRRSEREHLVYEAGRSESILAKFYQLLLLTRRRHQLPPQPIVWFRNLMECLADKLSIHLVSKDRQPIASIVTLFHKHSLVYKYGCSDARFHNLGGMPLLMWKAIQEGKQLGAQEFDLGRSDPDNSGLIRFKEHWGAASSRLNYYRYPLQPPTHFDADWRIRIVNRACARLPNSLLTKAGSVFYRHIG